jgi:MATE family multidrug resistance protein
LKNSLWANGMVALLLCGLMGALYLNIHRLGQPEELLPLMRPYYLVLLVSVLFVMLFNAFKQFADGITDTQTPMWILIGGNVLNIVGNWVLIYGHLGFPELGLFGAGIATLVSRILMFVVFFLIFLSAKRYAPYRKGFFQGRLNRSDFKQLNILGWPVGLQMGMETASFSLATIMVGWLGATALAAHQVMLTIGQLGYMIYYGMAAAVAVRVSNFHGQNDKTGVLHSANAGFHIILSLAVCLSVSLFFLRNEIGGWFTDNDEVTLMVASLIVPFIIYQFGDGMQCTYSNALRGIADVKPVMYIAFIAYFIISLPAGYLFGFVFDWGLTGIWLSFPFGLTSAGLMFWLRFRKQVA